MFSILIEEFNDYRQLCGICNRFIKGEGYTWAENIKEEDSGRQEYW